MESLIFACNLTNAPDLTDAAVVALAEREAGLPVVLMPGQSLRVERVQRPGSPRTTYRLYRVAEPDGGADGGADADGYKLHPPRGSA